jgi:hypothetical protein
MESSLPTLNDLIDPDNEKNKFYEDKKEIINNNKSEKIEDLKNNKINNIQENMNVQKNEDNLEKERKKTEIKNTKNNIKENNIKENNIFFEDNKIKENSNDNHLKELIKQLKEIELAGNEFYKKKLYDDAINKYKEGYEIINKELLEVNRNRMLAYHPEIQKFISLSKHIMSNLSLSYLKKEKYEESIQIDKKIFSLDPKYDKSYARLFNSYLKLNKKAEAVFFGDILIKNFNNEVKEKYKDLIPIIEKEKKNMEIEYEIEKENKKKEARKNFLKFFIPFIILIISYVYFRFFKK